MFGARRRYIHHSSAYLKLLSLLRVKRDGIIFYSYLMPIPLAAATPDMQILIESKAIYLPAEWAIQDAVLLTWPHAASDWQPWLVQVDPVFVEIARQVCRRERLIVSCFDSAHRDHVRNLLTQGQVDCERVALYIIPSNDSWVRDHGPITVLGNGTPRLLDFTFNGWGNKFAGELDNTVTRRLHKEGAFGATPLKTIDLVLEGGSIETDGQGTLLTTASCLLAPGRSSLTRHALEARLKEVFGLRRVLWLEHGYLAGDDTDGHIDTLARFCDPETICYMACDDPSDEHYPELNAMAAELRQFRTLDDQPYRLLPLPWPQARYNTDGRRLPASYANFLIINNAILAPTYADPADAQALTCLTQAFPRHEIVGIPCSPLIMQYGSLHCVTMQLPAGMLGHLL